ncbi:hypothetical protein EV281_10843 [Rhizobium sp. BK418]|nr:hypothetical protein EV281_10843 [Rhizobium sp. BK418]
MMKSQPSAFPGILRSDQGAKVSRVLLELEHYRGRICKDEDRETRVRHDLFKTTFDQIFVFSDEHNRLVAVWARGPFRGSGDIHYPETRSVRPPLR